MRKALSPVPANPHPNRSGAHAAHPAPSPLQTVSPVPGSLRPLSHNASLPARTSASTFTSIKSFDEKLEKNIRKYEKIIKSKDIGYIIPLNINDNITYLKNSRNISNYAKKNF